MTNEAIKFYTIYFNKKVATFKANIAAYSRPGSLNNPFLVAANKAALKAIETEATEKNIVLA